MLDPRVQWHRVGRGGFRYALYALPGGAAGLSSPVAPRKLFQGHQGTVAALVRCWYTGGTCWDRTTALEATERFGAREAPDSPSTLPPYAPHTHLCTSLLLGCWCNWSVQQSVFILKALVCLKIKSTSSRCLSVFVPGFSTVWPSPRAPGWPLSGPSAWLVLLLLAWAAQLCSGPALGKNLQGVTQPAAQTPFWRLGCDLDPRGGSSRTFISFPCAAPVAPDRVSGAQQVSRQSLKLSSPSWEGNQAMWLAQFHREQLTAVPTLHLLPGAPA